MSEIDDAKRLTRVRLYWRTKDPGAFMSDTDETFLLRLLDARDAALLDVQTEIERWRADYRDTVTCLNNERARFRDILDARDAALREAHEEIENLQADASNDGLRYREMRTGIEALKRDIERLTAETEALQPVVEAARRHIASYDPGTLIGSELNLALHLRDLDGDMWEPWCVPGTTEDEHQKPETGKGEGER